MNASLRAPTAHDFAAIASWVPDAAAALRWAGPRLPFPFAAADLPAWLALADCGQASYSLVDGAGQLCGFGQHWVVQPGAVHVGRIIVAPDSRGRGAGRELCQQLIAAALRATSATTVTLRVYKDNPTAVGLYARLGFAELAEQSTDDVFFMHMRVSG